MFETQSCAVSRAIGSKLHMVSMLATTMMPPPELPRRRVSVVAAKPDAKVIQRDLLKKVPCGKAVPEVQTASNQHMAIGRESCFHYPA